MATYSKGVLLRVTEEQHQKLTQDAAAAGKSVQNYVRESLFPEDPKAASSTPVNTAYAATNSEVKKLRNSLDTFYTNVEAGLLTHQPVDQLVQNAIDKGRAALTGEE